MGNQHPTSKYYKTEADEKRGITCSECGIQVEGLTYWSIYGSLKNSTFCEYYYDHSSADITMTFSGDTNKIGPSVGASIAIKSGTPMIKIFAKPHSKKKCTACFAKSHTLILKGLALSIKGKAAIINSNMTLSPANYGDI